MKSKKESMQKHTQKTIFRYNTIKFRYFPKKTMKGGGPDCCLCNSQQCIDPHLLNRHES